MKIKKIAAITLAAVFALTMLTGCMTTTTTTTTKDEGEVTIYVDESLKEMITAAATAYTKPVRELPEREKAIILITDDTSENIVSRIEAGEYADAVFVSGEETLDAIDAAANGQDFAIHSTRISLTGADGTVCAIAIMNNSDRQSVIQGFMDYLVSEEAETVLSEYGFTK